MATIYRKTAKGQTEVELRTRRLAPRFRNLLILVDGKRSSTELLRLVPIAGPQALEALAEGGFIEGVQQADEAPVGDGRSFEQLRHEAPRALIEHLGPMGQALAQRMAETRTPAELRALVQTASQVLANTRGRRAAASYLLLFNGPD